MQSTPRHAPPARPRAVGLALAVALGLATAGRSTGQATAPAPASASAGSPIPLAAYVPGAELSLYFEYQGLDAHTDAWRKSAAYKILNETPTGAMLEEVFVQLVNQTVVKGSSLKINGAEAATLVKHIARNGFVFGVSGKAGQGKTAVIVLAVRGVFKNKETRPVVGRLLGSMTKAKPKVVDVAGHKIVVQKGEGTSAVAWWVEDSRKEDLVFIPPAPGEAIVVNAATAILATLDGQQPSAVADPTRAALAKDDDGFAPVGFGFIDVGQLPPLPSNPAYGLQGIKKLDLRWGFQDRETVSILRVSAPKPRAGALALIDQPTFDRSSLPPIPEGVDGFNVFSIDTKQSFDALSELAKAASPGLGAQIDATAEAVKAKTRLRLKEDILGHLGPKVAVYIAPASKSSAGEAEKPAGPNPLAAMLGGATIPRVTMIAEIDDEKAFSRVLEELMIVANQSLRTAIPMPPAGGGGEAGPGRPAAKGARSAGPGVEFKLVPGPSKIYMLSLANGSPFASMLPAYVRPTIRVGPKHVAVSVSPDSARQALEVKGGGAMAGTFASTVQAAPANLLFLAVEDSKATLPDALATFPGKLQATINAAAKGAGAVPGANGPAPGAPAGGDSGGGIVFNVDPAKMPTASAIRPLLFPASVAVAVDGDGIKIVQRSAFPDLASMVAGNSVGSMLNRAMMGQSPMGMPPVGVPPGAAGGPAAAGPGPGGEPGEPERPATRGGRPGPGGRAVRPD